MRMRKDKEELEPSSLPPTETCDVKCSDKDMAEVSEKSHQDVKASKA